ncbi:MAG: hypothetical protein HY228_02875 [Candidatus Yonathbacteria bacterium]|nr:hypothetical protein [Candidatus Yonathbacteria bacterium]
MKKILLGTLLTLFLAVGTVSAQTLDTKEAGILPDSPFYFFDTLSERIGTFFTFGKVKKVERHLELASERLAESKALADNGVLDKAETTTEKYQEQIDEALTDTKEAKLEGTDTDALLEKIAGLTARHQAVLAKVYEKVPEQAKEAIQKVMEKSARGHDEALEAISGKKRQEAQNRVEQETKDNENELEGLRKLGMPIPRMGKMHTEMNDLIKDVDNIAPKGVDADTMGNVMKLEDELK